jgi:hypothetical protein
VRRGADAYRVPHSERFVEAVRAAITSPQVLALPPHLGGVAQLCDSTDVLDRIARCRKLAALYER